MSYEKSAQFYDYFSSTDNLGFYLDLARETEGDVLELGVGTGRVLFEIAKLGRDVVGIDTSVAMLREAKRKRRELYPEISGRCRLLLADMLSFDLGTTFGLIYAASSSVQGPSADDLRGIFRRAADHLADGGVFAFDVASPAAMRKTTVFPPERRELPGGRVVFRFVAQTYNEETDTTSFDLLFKEFVPGRTTSVTITEQGDGAVVTLPMLEDALSYARLEARSVYGDFRKGPHHGDSKWIVVVAGHVSERAEPPSTAP
jgi:SAM-dependent methyltransferase